MVQLEPRARREQWIDGNLPLLRLRDPATAGARCYTGSSSRPVRTQRACAAHSHRSEHGSLAEQVRAMYDDGTGCTRAHSEVGTSSA